MIAIDAARLTRRLSELARFGALPGGGVTRSCWGPAYEEARKWLLGEIRAAGLTGWVDGAGNVFGGTGIDSFSADRPAIVTGSHIDTVPEGGTLDGALGVIAGLECLQTIVENKATPRRPLAVAAWSDEEGRYGSLFGSRAFCSGIDPAVIAMALDGATNLAAADDGALVVGMPGGSVTFTPPVAWQQIDGERRPVAVTYAIDKGAMRYGFRVGAHDRSKPLVIDPAMTWNTISKQH